MSAKKVRPVSYNPRSQRGSVRFTVDEITDLALKAARANVTLSDLIRAAALEMRPVSNTALVRHDLSRIVVHLSRQAADEALIEEIRAALETL